MARKTTTKSAPEVRTQTNEVLTDFVQVDGGTALGLTAFTPEDLMHRPDLDLDDVNRIASELPPDTRLLISDIPEPLPESSRGTLMELGPVPNAVFRKTDPSIDGSDMRGDSAPLTIFNDASKKEEWRAKLKAAWTPEKRQALRVKLQDKYASGEIVHPMKGKNLRAETKERIRAALKGRTPLALCEVCGRPLTEHTSVESGVGPICAGKKLGITISGEKLNKE